MNNTGYTGSSSKTHQKLPSAALCHAYPHTPFLPTTGAARGWIPTLSTRRAMLPHKVMIEQIQAEQRAAVADVGIFVGKPVLSVRPGETAARRWDSDHQSGLNRQRETDRARQIGQRLAAEKEARQQRGFATQATEFVGGVVDGMISVISPQGAAAEAVDFAGAAESAAEAVPSLVTFQQRAEELGFSVQLHGVDDPANATLANMTVFFLETPGAKTSAEVCKLHEVVTEFLQASTELVGGQFSCDAQLLCLFIGPSSDANSLKEYRCEDIDPISSLPSFPPRPSNPDFQRAFTRLDQYAPPVNGNSTFVIWDKAYMDRWQPHGGFPYAVVSKNMAVPGTPQPAPAPSQPDVPPATSPPEMAPMPAPSQQENPPAPPHSEMPPGAFQPEPPPAQPFTPPIHSQPEISPSDLEPEMAPAASQPSTLPVPPQAGGLSLAAMWGIASGASVAVFALATLAYRGWRTKFAPVNPSTTTVTMSPLSPYASNSGASGYPPAQSFGATPPLTSVKIDSSSDTSSVVGSASVTGTSDDSSSVASGIDGDDRSEVLGAGHSSGD
jgi:hypothetical protein